MFDYTYILLHIKVECNNIALGIPYLEKPFLFANVLEHD